MQMQVEAERKKRAAILESEGAREAEVNIAEGKRLARILSSGNLIKKFYIVFVVITYNIIKVYIYKYILYN